MLTGVDFTRHQPFSVCFAYKVVFNFNFILLPYNVCRPEKEPQFKFIYFNHMNLAEKSTIHMRKTASVSLTSVHPDLMKILGDINCDFARYVLTETQCLWYSHSC